MSYQTPTQQKENKLLDMVAMRLRLSGRAKLPFERICAHEVGDKVALFVVSNNQATMIEDNADLFPSDTLITQLRLLAKEKDAA